MSEYEIFTTVLAGVALLLQMASLIIDSQKSRPSYSSQKIIQLKRTVRQFNQLIDELKKVGRSRRKMKE